ncbi:MAG: GerMN domain-containing protein [Candidatus Aminicenantes bacterium]|nr:GerMN domain-containing protein [Candidatus Aminicenantes bacterium]
MKAKKKKKIRLLFILVIILLIIMLVFFFARRKETIKHMTGSVEKAGGSKKVVEIEKKTITLFFLSENDELLHPEEREIYLASSSPDELARAIVEEIIKGSSQGKMSTLPEGTKLRQLYITSDGTAYVDFSRRITEGNYYGSSGEMAAVYSVVNSLAYNLKSVKKVVILVEGNEKETLGGHVDLSHPFAPDFSLVAK